ncbi:hypothetical protein GOODEAATRI_009991 [Goodea atripinnis]|uniref:Uncharacterized protein n=1 Tax=Goodea atripinnis TaxID=208336 RepID=A0ABV0PMA6_9TELE
MAEPQTGRPCPHRQTPGCVLPHLLACGRGSDSAPAHQQPCGEEPVPPWADTKYPPQHGSAARTVVERYPDTDTKGLAVGPTAQIPRVPMTAGQPQTSEA